MTRPLNLLGTGANLMPDEIEISTEDEASQSYDRFTSKVLVLSSNTALWLTNNQISDCLVRLVPGTFDECRYLVILQQNLSNSLQILVCCVSNPTPVALGPQHYNEVEVWLPFNRCTVNFASCDLSHWTCEVAKWVLTRGFQQITQELISLVSQHSRLLQSGPQPIGLLSRLVSG